MPPGQGDHHLARPSLSHPPLGLPSPQEHDPDLEVRCRSHQGLDGALGTPLQLVGGLPIPQPRHEEDHLAGEGEHAAALLARIRRGQGEGDLLRLRQVGPRGVVLVVLAHPEDAPGPPVAARADHFPLAAAPGALQGKDEADPA